MTIHLTFVTYNRLDYTKLALASVLIDPTEEFSLTIWDNHSTDGTVEYLKNEVSDPRISDIIFSRENIGQTAAVNKIWMSSKADLVGKLDNDCLVTPGWTRILAEAHEDIPNLGVVACWHFFPEDFDYERAKHKIQTFGRHRIFRHPWTCGTGLLLKWKTFQKFGPITGEGTTNYWLNIALAGYINGWYYPFVFQEHMDDPMSKYCRIKDKESFDSAVNTTVGLQAGRYNNPMGRLQWREEIVRNLLCDPYDPHYYFGWRSKLRRLKSRMRKFIAGKASKKQIDRFNG